MPQRARVVVIGGGIIGNSVAYHLSKEMPGEEVVLLERDRLTSGTTWHAAGLMVTYGSLSETSTELRKYTKRLYGALEQETGQATGFSPVGFIELASDADRLEEYRRVAAFNRRCGVDVEEISASEVKRLFPLCRVDDVLAGFYVRDDGRVNPADAAMALAKGARMGGVRILEGVSVDSVVTAGQGDFKRVTGVQTHGGRHTIQCDTVVNCAGMWARQLAQKNGIALSNQAAEHYYLVTDKMDDVDPKWPVVEDPANYAYIRPEAGGLMVGLFEGQAAAWNVQSVPSDFSFGQIPPDWERMAPYLEAAMGRVPRTLEVGAKLLFCGPESFTHDLAPLVGEAPEVRNYFVAAGLNSIGILTGGGIGRLMAHWIAHGAPDMDVTGMNVNRVHPYMSGARFREQRVQEALGKVYKCHYPTQTMESARNVKRSPFHASLAERGACFKDVSGWESPNWYAPKGEAARVEQYSFGRENYFPYWKAEHEACRKDAVLIDMSFMAKFMVQGKDAGAFLNRLSTAQVDGPSGSIVYTQWLNPVTGTLEADLTVSKLAEDRFMVVATDTMHRHVDMWMRRNLLEKEHVFISDVTGAIAQLNLQGPRARQILQAVVAPGTDVSDEAFPFRAIRELTIGMAPLNVARITYVGELGYELFIPVEFAGHVLEQLLSTAEREGGVRPPTMAGLRALGSLRMEKGYRDYGHDMDNTDSLLEVGLGFTCDFTKPGGFLGMEFVQRQKAKGVASLRKRLAQVLLLDPEPLMFHGEVVYRNGVRVGDIRSASYGHSLGGAVGLSMIEDNDSLPINKEYLESGVWEVEVGAKRYPAKVSLRPFYDPDNARIKM